MDKYQSLRSMHPMTVLSALGVNTSTFKKRSGKSEWSGKCPIHGSKNNSGCFSIHEDGRFGCFSCGAKGKGSIDIAMQIKQVGFKDAISFLESISGRLASQPPPAKEKPGLSQDLASDEVLKPLVKDTWKKFAVPCQWLEARVPSADIRELYSVFCYNNPPRKSAYSGRVMLPIKSLDGQLFGYLGRKPDNPTSPDNNDEPKYLVPKGLPKSRFLFGSDVLKAGKFGPAPLRVCYLLESPFAVMKFASMGIPAVSCLGWSVSPEQIQLLTHLTKGCIFLPDRNKHDAASEYAAKLAVALWLRFPPLPVGIDDPEQMTKEQILAL